MGKRYGACAGNDWVGRADEDGMRPVLMTIAVTAALLAACTPAAEQDASGPPREVESTASTPTPSSQPTTTPPALSKAQAARRYLQIVKPYNVAMETLEKAINAGQPMSRLTRLAEKAWKASKTELRALRATRWPSVVRAPVKELASAISAGLSDWRRATQAETREAMIEAVIAATRHGSDAAKTIRQRLQLEKYDEDDY